MLFFKFLSVPVVFSGSSTEIFPSGEVAKFAACYNATCIRPVIVHSGLVRVACSFVSELTELSTSFLIWFRPAEGICPEDLQVCLPNLLQTL